MKQMKYYLIIFSMLVLTSTLAAQSGATATIILNTDASGLAIEGYDPVAYILQQKAVEGNKSLSLKRGSTTYYFSTSNNRDLFKQNPGKYEPAYGGWCAYAMGNSGEKVEVDPETFKIIDGKTYLFYNFYLNNTLKDWNKDEKNLKSKADFNWKKISAYTNSKQQKP
jgi:YHS domain-containing protein